MAFGSTGIGVSGSVDGPPSPILGLNSAGYSVVVTGTYWVGPDRIPPTGCEWVSEAVDRTTGSITGLTHGGVVPFGPWPQTIVSVRKRHRVFSGNTLLVDEPEIYENILNIGDENTTETKSLPLSGVFMGLSRAKFDFDRTKGLAIELQVRFWIYLQGGGRVTFSGVNVALPQFDISSTL
jgi:hypothetical protein